MRPSLMGGYGPWCHCGARGVIERTTTSAPAAGWTAYLCAEHQHDWRLTGASYQVRDVRICTWGHCAEPATVTRCDPEHGTRQSCPAHSAMDAAVYGTAGEQPVTPTGR